MTKRKPPMCFAALLLAGLLLCAGCSGPDDLQVHNNYSFAVRLRHKGGDVIGTVPAHGMQTFSSGAGYKGDQMEGITFENEQGKKLGAVDASTPNVGHHDSGRWNGSEVWSLIVGP